MDPGQLIPTPDILPAPWGFFSLVSVLTFTLHIILANMLVGGGLFALWGHVRRNSGPPGSPMEREASRSLPIIMALTINLGVPPLLFLQVMYGQFIYVSSVLTAISWLSIFGLLIIAYYGLYLYRYKFEQWSKARPWIVGLSVLPMLLVGFFFTNSLLLMIDPGKWYSYFSEAGGRIFHLREPTLVPRFLHFLLSSLAVGGLSIALLGWFRARKGDSRWEPWIEKGLHVFGWVTLAQFIVGAWYLGGLPVHVLSTVFLEIGLSFPAFILGVMAGGVSILFAFNRMPLHTAGSTFLAILFMVVFRSSIRNAYLGPHLAAHEMETATQVGAAVLFVAALLGGLLVMVYLFKTLRGSQKESWR